MRFARVAALAVAVYGLAAIPAKAGFFETFDIGSAVFSSDEPLYWLSNPLTNAWVVQSTSSVPGWGNNIPDDPSGKGYFLFEGTGGDNPDRSLNEFYIGPTFSVVPDMLYIVSFHLAAGIGWSFASVQPEIDGSLLGSPVSPTAFFWDADGGWQQFSFGWNSGSNSNASLILHDYTWVGSGNDLGVDNISVETAPEPGTGALAALVAVMGLAVSVLARKRSLGSKPPQVEMVRVQNAMLRRQGRASG